MELFAKALCGLSETQFPIFAFRILSSEWLLNDISNRINRRYYIEILKKFKRIDTERGRYDIDTTVAFKHYLNEELYQYFLDKRVIF